MTAQLLMSKNAGAATVGPVSAVAGDTLLPVLGSSAGVTTWRVDMYSFPDNLALPAGWTLDVNTGFYYWSGPTSSSPPAVTWPATGTDALACFGDVLWMLTENGGVGPNPASLIDTAMATSVPGPTSGLLDTAYQEFTQLAALKKWVASLQKNWRKLETLLGVVPWSAVVTGAGPSTSAYELTDTAGGAFARTFPAAPVDRQRQRYKDATGSWATHNLTVTGSTGQKVENPASPGTYSATAGSQVLNVKGGSVDFEWSAAKTTWFVV